jgi:hypothetical protein
MNGANAAAEPGAKPASKARPRHGKAAGAAASGSLNVKP